jgi:prepilin peptidase CpaA
MVTWCAILVLGVAAIIDDMARRKISNWIPVCALLFGISYQFLQNSWRGIGSAMVGTLAGFAVFFIFYVAGGMGAGDIKLMAGFGAILGANGILIASLLTAVVGGIIAVLLVVFGTADRMVAHPSGGSALKPPNQSMPYAPAITLGVWLSQLAR